MDAITWREGDVSAMGVHERPFVAERDGDSITGLLWSPAEPLAEPAPLVLLGHGGRGNKRDAHIVSLGRRFARRHGIFAAAIDATGHGERGPITNADPNHPEYVALWQRPDSFDRMAADWRAVLDALSGLPEVDGARVAYWGLSMGTMFGLPFVAAEPRIHAAVLGLCGLSGPSAVRGRIEERHRADAPKVRVPLLFLVQLDDELFDTAGSIALFRLLGADDKRLYAYPGLHAAVGPEALDASREFLAARLASH